MIDLGSTFSHVFLKSMGIDPMAAIESFGDLGFSWVRLGCYWSEIEKVKGVYDFGELDKIVTYCGKRGIKIFLSVGMKAPRYPEYYLPAWLTVSLKLENGGRIQVGDVELLEPLLKFIENCVVHYKNNSAVKVWQVENEPLDPSGDNNWSISPDVLKREVSLVRKIDGARKIMISLWGNELTKRNLVPNAIQLGDIVGIDIYPRRPLGKGYVGPNDSVEELNKISRDINENGKEVWISELQMEPWEDGEIVTSLDNPESCLPKHIKDHWEMGKKIGPTGILLWGFEWWYIRRLKGDSRYWEAVVKNLVL